MTARKIDGKAIAQKIRQQLREETERMKADHGLIPGLAVILVGEDPASQVYVRNKKKACEEAGIASFSFDLPADTKEPALLGLIHQLNADPAVHGILVQLPLPGHIHSQKILEAISPNKDADGFHPYNVGRLATGSPTFRPCTPWGCMVLLEEIGVDPKGKEAVVVGRSNIVGKPIALMLLAAHATVTICHSRTHDLERVVRRGDIVVAAVGQAEMIRGDWIKEGAVVIDVGMNRLPNGHLCGDVAFQEAAKRASAITPVPGGVGPMTVTMLLKNTVNAAKRAAGLAS